MRRKALEINQKPPRNKAELEFWNTAHKKGWRLLRKGWPDFFCLLPDGSLCLVEVKPNHNHRLKASQILVMKELSNLGVKCFRWSPDAGLEQVVKEIPL